MWWNGYNSWKEVCIHLTRTPLCPNSFCLICLIRQEIWKKLGIITKVGFYCALFSCCLWHCDLSLKTKYTPWHCNVCIAWCHVLDVRRVNYKRIILLHGTTDRHSLSKDFKEGDVISFSSSVWWRELIRLKPGEHMRPCEMFDLILKPEEIYKKCYL